MWDLNSLTRDQNPSPSHGKANSQPLGHQGSKSLESSSCLTVFLPTTWNMLSHCLPVPIVSDEESIVNPLGSPFMWFFSCSFKVFSLSFSIFTVMCLGQELFALCSFCLESIELRLLCFSSNLGSFQLFFFHFSYFSSPSGISSTCMLMSLWCPIFLWGPIHFFYCHKIYIKFTIPAIFNCTI